MYLLQSSLPFQKDANMQTIVFLSLLAVASATYGHYGYGGGAAGGGVLYGGGGGVSYGGYGGYGGGAIGGAVIGGGVAYGGYGGGALGGGVAYGGYGGGFGKKSYTSIVQCSGIYINEICITMWSLQILNNQKEEKNIHMKEGQVNVKILLRNHRVKVNINDALLMIFGQFFIRGFYQVLFYEIKDLFSFILAFLCIYSIW